MRWSRHAGRATICDCPGGSGLHARADEICCVQAPLVATQELALIQLRVQTLNLHELGVAAPFDEPTIVEHEDHAAPIRHEVAENALRQCPRQGRPFVPPVSRHARTDAVIVRHVRN
jgi:hypothetical protein